MVDHNRARKWVTAALGFVIGVCGPAVSSSPPRSSQEASAVTYSTNELGMEFVMVPSGEVQMGCSEGSKPNECSKDEKPRHRVQITKAYEIGKTEVKQRQGRTGLGSKHSDFKAQDLPLEPVTFKHG